MRGQGKMSKRWRHAALTGAGIAMIAVASVGVLSVSAAAQQGLPRMLTFDEAVERFPEVTRSFEAPLPEGVDWPVELPSDVIASAAIGDVAVEPSFLETTAAFYWLCAWERELLDATEAGTPSRARSAALEVARFADLQWYAEHFDDPERIWFERVAEPALRGDLRGVEQDAAGCTSPR